MATEDVHNGSILTPETTRRILKQCHFFHIILNGKIGDGRIHDQTNNHLIQSEDL